MQVYHDFFSYPDPDQRFLKWMRIQPNDMDPTRSESRSETLIEMVLRNKRFCMKVPSDYRLNLLVQSNCNHGIFYLNRHSTKFSNEFPQKTEKKKILSPICDPMKRYPVKMN